MSDAFLSHFSAFIGTLIFISLIVKPIISALKKRSMSIKKSMARLNLSLKKADATLNQYQKLLKKTKSEAEKAIKETKNSSEQFLTQETQKLDVYFQQKKLEIDQIINMEEKKAIIEIKKEVIENSTKHAKIEILEEKSQKLN